MSYASITKKNIPIVPSTSQPITQTINSKSIEPRKFIDIGANLTDSRFVKGNLTSNRFVTGNESELHNILTRSASAGVESIIITSSNLNDIFDSTKIIKEYNDPTKYPTLYTTAGCHPTQSSSHAASLYPQDYIDSISKLIDLDKSTGQNKIVAIGECGLDYDRLMRSGKNNQLAMFPLHFKLTEQHDLPMFLHSRNCESDFIPILKDNRKRFTDGVVHSFTGSMSEAKEIIQMGLYLSINGVSMRTPQNCQVAKQLPLDRIMLETDAPWCEIKSNFPVHPSVKTPSVPSGAYRNEPGNIVQVLEAFAGLRGEDPTMIAETAYRNTKKIFNLS
jgi:TatD DNase family protein